MITERLAKAIEARKIQKIFFTFTSADRDRPLADFDNGLRTLASRLRMVAPGVAFDSNGSTECHRIILGDLPADVMTQVVDLFRASHLTLDTDHHFLALY